MSVLVNLQGDRKRLNYLLCHNAWICQGINENYFLKDSLLSVVKGIVRLKIKT